MRPVSVTNFEFLLFEIFFKKANRTVIRRGHAETECNWFPFRYVRYFRFHDASCIFFQLLTLVIVQDNKQLHWRKKNMHIVCWRPHRYLFLPKDFASNRWFH